MCKGKEKSKGRKGSGGELKTDLFHISYDKPGGKQKGGKASVEKRSL